jgi:excisionase family DNA binding protein
MGKKMEIEIRNCDEQVNDRLLGVKEVAELLGLAPGTIYHLVSQGRIPCVRLSSRCLRFRPSDLEGWIAGKVDNPDTTGFAARSRKR